MFIAAATPDRPSNYYFAPASSISINAQNKLEASRFLAPNQNNNFRIGGELNTKISISFVACNQVPSDDPLSTFNFASGVLKDLTGTNYFEAMLIGGNYFNNCYLDSVSVEINSFDPVMITADFTCLSPPTDNNFNDYSEYSVPDTLNSGIAYGFNTTITDGSTLSDANRESVSFKIICDRSYTTSIGNTAPNNIFLNGIEKELTIKSHNIGAYINFTGYGETITINPKNSSGQSIVSGGFGMSSNCKIISQNLSIQEGDVLMGDISLREIVL